MKLYELTIYCSSSYSYSGFDIAERFLFVNRDNAVKCAQGNRLEIIEYLPSHDGQCTIDEIYTVD